VVVASPPIVISGPMKERPPAPAFARAGLAALVCWVRENMSCLPLLARMTIAAGARRIKRRSPGKERRGRSAGQQRSRPPQDGQAIPMRDRSARTREEDDFRAG
jgi:hypothetical protein